MLAHGLAIRAIRDTANADVKCGPAENIDDLLGRIWNGRSIQRALGAVSLAKFKHANEKIIVAVRRFVPRKSFRIFQAEAREGRRLLRAG